MYSVYVHVHCICTYFQVTIMLNETETIWLLDIPSAWVAPGTEEAETVQKNNERYEKVA